MDLARHPVRFLADLPSRRAERSAIVWRRRQALRRNAQGGEQRA
jgi:hypothetical protein